MLNKETELRNGRVAVVGRYPPPLDGQSILTRGLADMLERAMSPDPTDSVPARMSRVVLRVNTDQTWSGDTVLAPKRIGRITDFIRLRFRISRQLQQFDPDTIFWSSISPDTAGHFRDLVCVLSAIPREARMFAVIHRGNFEKLFMSRATGLTARRIVGRIDGFVFNSDRLARRCAPWIPAEKRFVVPNTIESDMLFNPEDLAEKRSAYLRRNDLRVLYLSNMIPSKGYFDVASALAIVDDTNVRAEFAGGWIADSDRLEFEQYLERERLSDQVRVHGAVKDRGRIRELLRNADVLVLPTYYPNEAQPLSIVEALNAGIPVIATRHRSIPDMIEEDQSGYFVAPKAPDEIAAAISKLRDRNTWLRISQGARRRFEERFSAEVVLDQWLRLLHEG